MRVQQCLLRRPPVSLPPGAPPVVPDIEGTATAWLQADAGPPKRNKHTLKKWTGVDEWENEPLEQLGAR